MSNFVNFDVLFDNRTLSLLGSADVDSFFGIERNNVIIFGFGDNIYERQ